MESLLNRLLRILTRPTGQLAIFSAIALLTLAWVFKPLSSYSYQPPISSAATSGALSGSVTVVQPKVLQGSAEDIAVKIELDVEAQAQRANIRTATDFVVVLDRSGSMAAENKLQLAKTALTSLVKQLTPNDRFALIAFDNDAQTLIPLGAVSSSTFSVIDSLVPLYSTNMSAGLDLGLNALKSAMGNRKRVILISDGQANMGVTDLSSLQKYGKRAVEAGAVLSSIGVGEDFNEILLSSISDFGMGQYSYLQNAAQLDTVLAKELGDSRTLYASSSEIIINPGPGVTLSDASGYPFSRNGEEIHVVTGAINTGTKRTFYLNFRAPSGTLGSFSLASVKLQAKGENVNQLLNLTSIPLQFAVLPIDKQQEVAASLNETVYRENWMENTMGRLKRDLNAKILSGKKSEADGAIVEFKRKIKDAEAASSLPLTGAVTPEIQKLEQGIERAFDKNAPDAASRQNKLAKSVQYSAKEDQRKVYAK